MKNEFSDFTNLDAMKDHPVSAQIDDVFKSVIAEERKVSEKKDTAQASGETINELDLDNMDEMEIDLGTTIAPAPETSTLDEGIDLSFSESEELDLGDPSSEPPPTTDGETQQFGDISLEDDDAGFTLTEEPIEDPGNLNLSSDSADEAPDLNLAPDDGFSLTDTDFDVGEKTTVGANALNLDEDFSSTNLKLSDDELSAEEDLSLSLDDNDDTSVEADLSEDAKEKLKEIDAIMDYDASRIGLTRHNLQNHLQSLQEENVSEDLSDNLSLSGSLDENLDEPLVSDDLDLGSIDFGSDPVEELDAGNEKTTIAKIPEQLKKKKKESAPAHAPAPELGRDLSEISVAYSGEMERMQATISNLRTDREELLSKIQKLEEEKVLQARQSLTMRAELDEKKIELTIIRKKLNEEINELKDRLKLFEEKKLIMEEKNRILLQELDKANQRSKIDVKKVQLREKELEQKLELLKSDAESQIRHRDLKILELKRKIDAMEFDMESISQQEKRSVESRFELEDKLEKAIKTLRGAITVLEDESERSNALEALKKNIDM